MDPSRGSQTKFSLGHLSQPQSQATEETKAQNVKRIATDLLALRCFDLMIKIPRHIDNEQDELWIPPPTIQQKDSPKTLSRPQFPDTHAPDPSLQGAEIPKRLTLIPADADQLIDFFFENAYFYFPIFNRSVVELAMMEPNKAHSLLLLNVVFMTACKHMHQAKEFDRALTFRDRARELQSYVDSKMRLMAIQAQLLGKQVTYGVFTSITCASMVLDPHAGNSASVSSCSSSTTSDHQMITRDRSLPEAVYQARLWVFWGIYLRDCISRLYWGCPVGFDNTTVTADLPRIEGCVGFGPKRRLIPDRTSPRCVIGKRRDTRQSKNSGVSNKRRSTGIQEQGSILVNVNYRSRNDSDSDNEDDESEEDDDDDDDSVPVGTRRQDIQEDQGLEGDCSQGKVDECDAAAVEMDLHMDRMQVLIESEQDPTDNGTFVRRIFIEEIRLWTIGRQVSLYLSGRSIESFPGSISFACPQEPLNAPSSSSLPFASLASSVAATLNQLNGWWRHPAAALSEQAWLQDLELQSLQRELITWERDLPEHLRFRSDVEAEDINHSINGVVIMAYYTITVMLQSAYLPSVGSGKKTVGTNSVFASPGGLNSRERCGSPTTSSVAQAQARSSRDSPTCSFSNEHPHQHQEQQGRFANTAHRICTNLSNTILHHVELMLDTYPNWCSIQAKVNHALTVALRVACENSKPNMTSPADQQEAQAQFKKGIALYKRLALLPAPLTIRDRPAEVDVQQMESIEDQFREMLVTTAAAEENEKKEENDGGNHGEPTSREQEQNGQPEDTTAEGIALSNLPPRPQPHVFGNEEEEPFDFDFLFSTSAL
ncbi:hypothetical protein BGZ83_001994 [Gryganskiella cystojenkinii]|nr:hypothetical protein BGZ83_001994 [Gryganskiella cystojenkinii]